MTVTGRMSIARLTAITLRRLKSTFSWSLSANDNNVLMSSRVRLVLKGGLCFEPGSVLMVHPLRAIVPDFQEQLAEVLVSTPTAHLRLQDLAIPMIRLQVRAGWHGVPPEEIGSDLARQPVQP